MTGATDDYQESSGNIFADMELDGAEELLTRAKLGYAVRQILRKRGLKQREIAALLNIKQPEVSNLMQGKYHLFSETRLFDFLSKVDRKVIIHITRRKKGEASQDVVFT